MKYFRRKRDRKREIDLKQFGFPIVSSLSTAVASSTLMTRSGVCTERDTEREQLSSVYVHLLLHIIIILCAHFLNFQKASTIT